MPYGELAAATRTPIIAAASNDADHRIDVWDVDRIAQIGSFETTLSPFGRRLALTNTVDGLLVIAASWGVPGVRAHDPVSGEVRWERRDLVRSGPIIAGGDHGLVAVAFSDRPAEVLDATDGSTAARLRGVRSVWQSPFASLALLERTGQVRLAGAEAWDRRWSAPLDGFAIGSAAFSPDAVLYAAAVDGGSIARTPIVCRSIEGAARWRFDAPPNRSVPWLAWDDERQEWIVLEFDLEARRQDVLVRLSTSGEMTGRFDVGVAMDYSFVSEGRRLVASNGSILDTRSGQLVGTLGRGHDTT